MIYAGIGSRKTPAEVLLLMMSLARKAGVRGHTLRSGHAPGADKAFEVGAREVMGDHEIYLPWKSFEGGLSDAALDEPTELAHEIASKYHPTWSYLSQGARKLHARNSHQILGATCNLPCDAVVCWSDGSGGTEQAIRIAVAFNIPVYNLYDEMTFDILSRI